MRRRGIRAQEDSATVGRPRGDGKCGELRGRNSPGALFMGAQVL